MITQRIFAAIAVAACLTCSACASESVEPSETAVEQTAKSSLVRETTIGPVHATVTLTPEKPVLGDSVTLEIKVDADSGVDVDMPEFGDQLGRFSIADFKPFEQIDAATGRIHKSQTYTLDLPMSGKLRLPSFLIEFTDNRESADAEMRGKVQELLTEEVTFEVESVLPDGKALDTLNPARGPLEELVLPEASNHHYWVWILLGLIAIAGGVIALTRRPAEKAALPPHIVALNALDRLQNDGIPSDPDKVDAWYVQVSGVLRNYVEGRFSLHAPRLTTEEFFELAKESDALDANQKVMIRGLLERADRVKFTEFVPSKDESQTMLDETRQFVINTKPVDVNQPDDKVGKA